VFNLAVILRESAAAAPDKPVAVWAEGRMSYAELDDLSDRVAVALADLGVVAGERIGLQLPNIASFLVAYFGILKAGAVVVPLNVLLKTQELAYHLGHSSSRVLITWAGVLDHAAAGAAQAGVRDVFVVGEIPAWAHARPFDDLLAASPSARPMAVTNADDTAVIVYTSGTTGRPKGAQLTHFQLYMNADIPGRLFDVHADDVVLAVLPLFHVFGLSSVLNCAVRFGATVALVPRFTPDAVLTSISRDRATVFEGVPTMFVALLTHPDLDRYDVSSLRIAISGGAAIPARTLDAFEARFGLTILEGYGMTETASSTTSNTSAEDRRPYSVGKPIWGTECQVRDDKDRPLPSGRDHVGEIVTRGFHTMKGYLDDPQATADAFAGGWLHTGDLGYRDQDGFFFVVGRKKELIIRGGYNVYPREVEEVLYSHPAVAEAAVIGIADERLGEEVLAFVALEPGAQTSEVELIAYCRDWLAAYKYPRVIELRPDLPKSGTGKILKLELKAQLAGDPPARGLQLTKTPRA
jgi:long-chain acyl-CoA synthetase